MGFIERFENIYYAYFIWIIPFIILLYYMYFRQKDRLMRIFATNEALKKISVNSSRKKQVIKALLIIFAIGFIIISLMRPQGDPTPENIKQTGRDIVFLLDVSESMNATDLKPTRLERAKIAIIDLVSKLQGDRVGLIIFSGSSSLKSPLTNDYSFFINILKNTSTDDIPDPGTNIGDAIRKAEEIFNEKEKKFKDIILITDGEDQNSWPVKAAERAATNSGIRIFTVGLGDPEMGALVTTSNSEVSDKQHRSKLNTALLQEIALAHPEGAFLPAKTGNFDLSKIYLEKIAAAEKRELKSFKTLKWKDFYQIPLSIAIILLLIETFLSETVKNANRNKDE
ncbi:VWA domain-containing protein [Candidatus Dependentiae bacterium]|nr:VWA domain-containing protein [Candidatus Dependentiae bacterium]